MNLCDAQHQEICFEGRGCPFCDMITEKDKKISKKNKEIYDLETNIDELENKIHDMVGL